MSLENKYIGKDPEACQGDIQELERLVYSRREEIDQLKSTILLKELELESLVEKLETAKIWVRIWYFMPSSSS